MSNVAPTISTAGKGIEENWQALFRLMDLMHKVGIEMGETLGFTYPDSIEQRVRDYLGKMKNAVSELHR